MGGTAGGTFTPFSQSRVDYDVELSTRHNGALDIDINGKTSQFTNSTFKGALDDQGDLRIDFYGAERGGNQFGTEILSKAITTADPSKVRTVSGEFGLTNKEVFDNLIESGANQADAAWQTPLGKSLKELGFTDVKVDGTKNGLPHFVFGF